MRWKCFRSSAPPELLALAVPGSTTGGASIWLTLFCRGPYYIWGRIREWRISVERIFNLAGWSPEPSLLLKTLSSLSCQSKALPVNSSQLLSVTIFHIPSYRTYRKTRKSTENWRARSRIKKKLRKQTKSTSQLTSTRTRFRMLSAAEMRTLSAKSSWLG